MRSVDCLITGGTGSFGRAMVERLLKEPNTRSIKIFSRDEKKQDEMKHEYLDPRISYIIGDTRDYDSIRRACEGVDFVFSAAALKQVPSCEDNPMQAVMTNVIGSANVMRACADQEVSSVVMLSTDKAVAPVNTMGMTKALMEKMTKGYSTGKTCICATRYGNVMASRGSVIPLFIDQIKKGIPLTITDPDMTRFMMLLGDAVELVMLASKVGFPGGTFVMRSPAATVRNVAIELSSLFEVPYRSEVVGIRPGEKMHETLVSAEEMTRSYLYEGKYIVIGAGSGLGLGAYTSDNTVQIEGETLRKLLLSCPYVKKELESWKK